MNLESQSGLGPMPASPTLPVREPVAVTKPTSLRALLHLVLRDREQLLLCIFSTKDLGNLLVWMTGTFLLLGGFYGFVMGVESSLLQALSSGLKIPLLYLLSLVVCFPVLYVVNVLMGSRLGLRQTLALMLTAFSLNAVLLASCGPIVLFFIVTGADYHFLKLLHVFIMGFAGLYAMLALHRALVAMCESSDVYPRQAVRILLLWVLVFGFVGTQMAWTLRPFLGAPDLAFEWFRHDVAGNFYQAVWQALRHF